MPKYLIEGSYTADGLKGLVKDTGSGRKSAIQKATKGMGGKLEAMYFSFGKSDVVAFVDMPDNISVAALSVAIGSSGLVRIRTTPLLTAEEMDKAVKHKAKYKAPGEK